MLVLDTSLLVPNLGGDVTGRAVATLMEDDGESVHIPELAVVEVVSVLRGLVRGQVISAQDGARALRNMAAFRATRWPMDHLATRIWELRDNISAYDAAYVALAEALGATLATHDMRLVDAVRQVGRCAVTVV